MRCKMKAMIMDMCMLSHKTQCFLMFGHLVGVGAGKLRGLPILLQYYYYYYYILLLYIVIIYCYPLVLFESQFLFNFANCMVSIFAGCGMNEPTWM